MGTALARRQRAQTKRETAAELKRRARVRLKSLREELRAARQAKKEKLRAVARGCRSARSDITRRAKRARERLRRSIQRTREKARSVCDVARGDARAETLLNIERRARALELEQAEQRRDRIWARPARSMLTGRGLARERQDESDGEVAANIDDPGLRVVWEAVKQRIKPGKHRSRTEAFFEWAAEHAADVYAIQEADAVRHLAELERQERALSRAVRKGGRALSALDAVPF
jgi:hypothetical protein